MQRELPVALIDRIIKCFDEVPPVDEAEISFSKGWEGLEICKSFSKYIGHAEIPNSIIEYHADSLPGFTDEGYRYFIKYYILYSLRNPDSSVTEYLLFDLSSCKEYRKNIVELFSADQKACIFEYISWAKKFSDEFYFSYADYAKKYWHE